jgi:hypothetical protein
MMIPMPFGEWALLGGAATSVLPARMHWLSRQGRVGELASGASWHLTPARLVPHEVPAVATSNHGGSLLALRLLAQAGSPSPHLLLGEDRNRLAGCCCERKQRRGRFLTRGQRALKDHGLLDEAAAAKMADRHDQTRPMVAIAKIELACIRPSAAVLPLGISICTDAAAVITTSPMSSIVATRPASWMTSVPSQ